MIATRGRVGRVVGIGLLLAPAAGCATVCLARQHRGPVATITGEVAPGETAVHRVPYGIEGSQNDLRISWDGQGTPEGPQLRVYATRIACEQFVPGAAARGGPCAELGSSTSTLSPAPRPCTIDRTCRIEPGDLVQRSLIITNGRGNPDVLGSPAEYKLWVSGDPGQAVRYTIRITWFRGPDC